MRVNIDDKIESDPRVTLTAARLGMNRFELVGRLIPVWMAAYRNRSAIMPRRNVDALAQHAGFVVAMIEEDLATPVGPDAVSVRLRGVTERIEFLEIQDAKRQKANAAKRASAGLPPGLPPGHAGAGHPGLPYSPTLTLTPTPDQNQDQAQDRKAASVEASPLHPEALRLSRKLHDLIARSKPGTKIAKLSGEALDKTVRAWAEDIDKLERIDGIGYPDIEATIAWCQADEFWAANILSGRALRRSYDSMLAQRTSPARTKHVGRAEPASADDFTRDLENPNAWD